MDVYDGLLLMGACIVTTAILLFKPRRSARSARIDRLLEEAAERRLDGGPRCWALLPSQPSAGDVCVRADGHPGPHRSRHDDGGHREWFDSADHWTMWRRRPTGRFDG